MQASKTFVIRHKETGEHWRAQSGKTSWRKTGHAKLAWANTYHETWRVRERCEALGLTPIPDPRSWAKDQIRFPRFNEQDVYEVVELKSSSESRLQKAEELLRFCVGRLHDTHFEEQVKQFLEEKN